MLPFRIMYPHIGFLVGLFRLCGACSALPLMHPHLPARAALPRCMASKHVLSTCMRRAASTSAKRVHPAERRAAARARARGGGLAALGPLRARGAPHLRSPGPGACSPPRGHEARQMRLAAGAQVGTIMLMYIMALAYAASSPIILPFTLAYFIVSW